MRGALKADITTGIGSVTLPWERTNARWELYHGNERQALDVSYVSTQVLFTCVI